MIKFFRKIRQNLLMQNKTSKYFKYAIGEIVLVVVGILIALQINNWNENKKSKQFEIRILKEIKASMQLDLERNKAILEKRILPKKRGLENLMRNMHSSYTVSDSILRNNFADASRDILFTYDKGAYESLKAIGLDKISQDSLRNRLIRFYENWLPRARELLIQDDETYTQRIKLRRKVFQTSYAKGKKSWFVQRVLNTQNLKNNKDLLELLDIEGDIYWNNKRVIEPIIKEAEAIISLIDVILSNND